MNKTHTLEYFYGNHSKQRFVDETFTECIFENVNFQWALFENVNFNHCILRSCDFSLAVFANISGNENAITNCICTLAVNYEQFYNTRLHKGAL